MELTKPKYEDYDIDPNDIDEYFRLKSIKNKLENRVLILFYAIVSTTLTVLFLYLNGINNKGLPFYLQFEGGYIILTLMALFAFTGIQIIIWPITFLYLFIIRQILKIYLGKNKYRISGKYDIIIIDYNRQLKIYNDKVAYILRNDPLARKYEQNMEVYFEIIRKENEKNELIKREKDRKRQIEKQKEKLKLDYWQSLSGFDFEYQVYKLFVEKGYNAKLTSKTGDGGIDIVLRDKSGSKIIVQCKNHKAKIGPSTVRDLYGVLISEKAIKAILINSGGFTSGVYNFTKGKPIELWNVIDLINNHKDSKL